MIRYNPAKIEKKWQKKWYQSTLFKAKDSSKQEKTYLLVEFPYPSGDGLHVGHCRSYTALDIIARKRRMQGQNVLFPMGWDALGLPTENYAIKMGVHPSIVTKKNTDNFRKQMKSLGLSFDWSRGVNTTDPKYYKWTQWIFVKLFEKGLAYKEKMAINWCPKDKTGLANEEVINGRCERCGTAVEKREKEQWLIKITKYADRLIEDLKLVDYPERVKIQQKEWIGKSEGININYKVKNSDKIISVFTTRPDTNFGATFVVAAPDGKFVKENLDSFPEKIKVKEYIKAALVKSDMDRTATDKKKTGVFTGWYAINSLNNKEMPIYVGDFVLGQFGTGCVVGVPGHDVRDFEFAKAMGLEVIRVVVGKDGDTSEIKELQQVQEEEGIMINSGFLNGKEIHEATKIIMDYIVEHGWGKKIINYKLRDWIFSRQHYWGEPIPMIFCEHCAKEQGVVANIIDKRNPPVPGKKFVTRKNVHAIVKDPKTGKYLALKWKKFDWITFPMGGVGEKEDVVEAAKREVKEETGYTNLKLVQVIKGTVRAEYFAAHKDENRIAFTNAVVFDLVGQEKVEISEEEKNNHNIIWLDRNQLNYDVMTHAEVEEWTKRLDNPDYTENSDAGWFPVPEKELPVELAKVKKYEPTDTGESPLAVIEKFVNVKCPNCGGPAKRETDTMPNWAGSNWYYLAYLFADKLNAKVKSQKSKFRNLFAESKKVFDYWMPVDWYNGGMEHTTLHLLYSRFIYKFLWDIGAVPKSLGSEPYKKRTSHGIILGPGAVKMSKSRGNVINPDDVVKQYGADTLRIYEMFMGPFEQMIPWDEKGIIGVRRFLEKVYHLVQINVSKKTEESLVVLLNKTVKKVSEDIELMKFNTAVSSMMEFANAWHSSKEGLDKKSLQIFLSVLSPFAPHVAEELWSQMGFKGLASQQKWPEYDKNLIIEEKTLLIVQINGKVREKIEMKGNATEGEMKKIAMESPRVKHWIDGKKVIKIVVVPGKLINIVTE